MESNDGCLATFCTAAFCGDGFIYEGMETCDDGNLEDNDECPSSCAWTSWCSGGLCSWTSPIYCFQQ